MKKIVSLLITITIIISSCIERKKSAYTIYWQDNNLCIVMPHPTIGIIGFNQEDWNGVDLSEVANDVHNQLASTTLSGEIPIWVRFEIPHTDKYGNESIEYDDHQICSINISEAIKYQSGYFLNLEYHIIDNIRNAAFGNTN